MIDEALLTLLTGIIGIGMKIEERFILLVKIFLALSVLGLAAFFASNFEQKPSVIAFGLVAFVFTVAALIMTTLQSISIARQARVTKHASELVKETARQVEILVKEDRLMKEEIRQDLEMDRAIVAALEEHGVGDNEQERHQVAKTIVKKITKLPPRR